nr:MAG TPA: hypothetical protein [Caudoviricetes sp.]
MIFKNSIITVFHYDDVNETYTKKMFSGAEVTKAEGISADKSGDNEKTSGIIRIPSKKSLEIFAGDFVYIGKTDDLRPDRSRVNKIVTVKNNLRGAPFLRHIRVEFI